MAISTYQQLYEFRDGEYYEKHTRYEEEGYKLKFGEYYLWRLTGDTLYRLLKQEHPELDLGFIDRAKPEGEGDKEYTKASLVKDQMKLLLNAIASYSGALTDDDKELLDSAKKDAEKLLALSEFAESKQLFISIGLDA
jgi:hypothetical protein